MPEFVRNPGFAPDHLILHDYGGTPKGSNPFNPYHSLVLPSGEVVRRDWGQKAPHAFHMNPRSMGLSYGGEVGSTPTPAAMEALRREYELIRAAYPSIQDANVLGHGEAFARRGELPRASRDGRDLVEASWRAQLLGVSPENLPKLSLLDLETGKTPRGAPPAQPGVTQIATSAAPTRSAAPSAPAAGGTQMATAGGDRQQSGGIMDALNNPLVMAGLMGFMSAASGKDATPGISAGLEAGAKMQATQEQQRRKAAVSALLSSGALAGSAPQGLLSLVSATGDVSPIAKYLGDAPGHDLEKQRLKLLETQTQAQQDALRRAQEKEARTNDLLGRPDAFSVDVPKDLVTLTQATGDPSVIGTYLTKRATADQTTHIKEYERAKAEGFKGSLADWIATSTKQAGEYNKTPIFGTRTGADGKPEAVMLQPGSRGDAVATKLPEGVTVNAQKPIEIDAGTQTVLLDPITRQMIGSVPKNVAEKAQQAEVGKAVGEAQVSLPSVESNLALMKRYMSDVRDDPYLPNMTGIGAWTPNVTTSARELQAKIDQLSGKAFVQAFQGMKGAGAITEQEGRGATQAMSRLAEQKVGTPAYKQAINDLEKEVEELAAVVRKKAGMLGGGGAATAAPQQTKRLRYNPQTGRVE